MINDAYHRVTFVLLYVFEITCLKTLKYGCITLASQVSSSAVITTQE